MFDLNRDGLRGVALASASLAVGASPSVLMALYRAPAAMLSVADQVQFAMMVSGLAVALTIAAAAWKRRPAHPV